MDFLPQFGMVLSFARDGSAAVMVKFNTDYTRSLYLVTNQGTPKELLRIKGSILSAQFDPLKQTLYCLLTRLLPGKGYNEQPYIAKIDLATAKLTPLFDLPSHREVQFSLAPDGSALVFDQPTQISPAGQALTPEAETAITTSNLWFLPLPISETRGTISPTALNLEVIAAGLHPQWLP